MITYAAENPDAWGVLGKAGRWRSRRWRQWVRQLGCYCREGSCVNCGSRGLLTDSIVAAHWRTNASGMGRKPDDFLVYPLANSQHTRYHNRGQPSHEWQALRVGLVWEAAFAAGILRAATPNAESLRGAFHPLAKSFSEHELALVVTGVRDALRDRALEIGNPIDLLVDF